MSSKESRHIIVAAVAGGSLAVVLLLPFALFSDREGRQARTMEIRTDSDTTNHVVVGEGINRVIMYDIENGTVRCRERVQRPVLACWNKVED